MPGNLTALLNNLVSGIVGGYGFLLNDAMYLLGYFVVIEMVILGILWSLGKGDIVETAIMKITMVGIFIYIIQNAHDLSTRLIQTFGRLGLKAGGNVMPMSDVLDPSKIINQGLTLIKPLMELADKDWAWVTNPVNTVVFLIAALIIAIVFFFIALIAALTVIEFYIITVIGTFLISFGIFKPLSYLGERSISASFCIAIKFMVLTFVMSIMIAHISALSISADPTLRELFLLIFDVAAVAIIVWQVPNLAMGLFSGSSNLGGGGIGGLLVGGALLGGSMAKDATVSPLRQAAKHVGAKIKKAYGGE